MKSIRSGITGRQFQPQKLTRSSVKCYFSSTLGIFRRQYSTRNLINSYSKFISSKSINLTSLYFQSSRAKSTYTRTGNYEFTLKNKPIPTPTEQKTTNRSSKPVRSEKDLSTIGDMAKSILPGKRESTPTDIFKGHGSSKTFVNLTFKSVGHIIDHHYFDAPVNKGKAGQHFDYGKHIPLKTLPSLVAAAARYGKVVDGISTDSKSQVVVFKIFADGREQIANMPVKVAKNNDRKETHNVFVKSLYIADSARSNKVKEILGPELASIKALERDPETNTWRPQSSTV